MNLTKKQKKELLDIARRTIKEHLFKYTKYEPYISDNALKQKRGIFVTLKKKGFLRGCIGSIFPRGELYVLVGDMAIQAAFFDPRFSPVVEDEIDEIEIEISLLTLPRKVKDAGEITIPGDGVIVKKGNREGVFLPQVAEETGWEKEEFLNKLCSLKAGLSPRAWRDPLTELFIFNTEVFSEKELNKNE